MAEPINDNDKDSWSSKIIHRMDSVSIYILLILLKINFYYGNTSNIYIIEKYNEPSRTHPPALATINQSMAILFPL